MSPLAPVATADLVAELVRRFATDNSTLHLFCTHYEPHGLVQTRIQSGTSEEEIKKSMSLLQEWVSEMTHSPGAMSYDEPFGAVIDVR